MKKLLALTLALTGCYHMKNARFLDESDTDPTAKVWVCTADTEEPTNVAGLMCADMRNVLIREKPDQDVGAASKM